LYINFFSILDTDFFSVSEFPLVQTKIVDFFKIKRTSGFEKIESKKRKRKNALSSKKKRKLLPFNPTVDPRRRLEQMASLATALTSTGTVFSNELTYVAGMAPKSANRASREKGGMQVHFSVPFNDNF
jgi:[histone H3]-lysine27 N-methyltransferase